MVELSLSPALADEIGLASIFVLSCPDPVLALPSASFEIGRQGSDERRDEGERGGRRDFSYWLD
jgi:hypothetical protein